MSTAIKDIIKNQERIIQLVGGQSLIRSSKLGQIRTLATESIRLARAFQTPEPAPKPEPPAVTPETPVVVVPSPDPNAPWPTPSGLQLCDPITFESGGDLSIIRQHVVARMGVQDGYALRVLDADVAELQDSQFDGYNYAAWVEANALYAKGVKFITHGGGDDYPMRAYLWICQTEDCVFDNTEGDKKAACRIIGCIDHQSVRDHYKGGRVMNGGGPANEWDGETPARRNYELCRFEVDSFQVYDKSVVVARYSDFAGTGHIFMDDGSELTLIGCRNLPEIRRKSIAGTKIVVLPG